MTAMTLSPSGLSPTEKSKINSIGKNPAKTTTAERASTLPLSYFLFGTPIYLSTYLIFNGHSHRREDLLSTSQWLRTPRPLRPPRLVSEVTLLIGSSGPSIVFNRWNHEKNGLKK